MNHITVEERHQPELEEGFGGGAECLTETNAELLTWFYFPFSWIGGLQTEQLGAAWNDCDAEEQFWCI